MFFETLNINWEFVAGLATTIGAAVWAIITFLTTRRRELAWKRTEFIVGQLQYLSNDSGMLEFTRILYGIHPLHTIDDFVAASIPAFRKEQHELIMLGERFLNCLWMISYACITLKTLTKEDVSAFGYYIERVSHHTGLAHLCREAGYEEIIEAARLIGCIDDNYRPINQVYAEQTSLNDPVTRLKPINELKVTKEDC